LEISRKADSFSEICKSGRRRDQDDLEYPMQQQTALRRG
jgi:hypothetical protein